MPVKGARCLAWDCPRKSWTVAGMGSGLSMRARAGDHWEGAPGRCAKASRKDKWADASAGSARWRAGAGSGSQVLLQLLEGPPAGAGQRALSTRRITSAPGAAVDAIPFPVLGMDFDNGSEFINHGVVRWAGNPGHLLHPLAPVQEERPGHHRVQEQPRGAPLRLLLPPRTPTPSARCSTACGSRPDTRVNFLTPTRKPIGWGADRAGRRKRLYDRPRTPLDRLLDTDALTDAQKDELIDYRNRLNPAVITRRIIELQDVLVRLAKDKTDQLHLAQIPSILPDVRKGIRVRRASPAAPDHAGSST